MTKIQYAVAAALALGASAAQAGITIPAGDWTIDIGGNVNAFYTHTECENSAAYTAAAGKGAANVPVAGVCVGNNDEQNIRTGLLPSALGIGGKTRQNDLDVAFQFTFFVGADDNAGGAAGGGNSINIRQAYGSFGDKSWGTIKFGRDLGIVGSDAILSDMTLLGVGHGANGSGGTSTLGRIGAGYLYADWVGQISYASPNWNGFSFAVGIRDSWATDNEAMGYEGKVSYEWAGDVAGKVWAGYLRQDDIALNADADVWEIGGKVSMAGFELVGNYQDGEAFGIGMLGSTGVAGGKELDNKSWYVQGSYKLPNIGTKIGVSYGESTAENALATGDIENNSWMIGVYHPLTKSLNLVAEYVNAETELGNVDGEADTFSLGAIMFF